MHDAGGRDEPRHILRDQQAIGALGDFGRAGDDQRGIANRFDFDDVVHVVALDLPGDAGEGHQVVCHHDHAVGVHRIGQRESE